MFKGAGLNASEIPSLGGVTYTQVIWQSEGNLNVKL